MELRTVEGPWQRTVAQKRQADQFVSGRVVGQIWDHVSEDGVRWRSLTLSRYVEDRRGYGTKPELLLREDLRDCKRVLKRARKWWLNERKRARRPLLRRLLGGKPTDLRT